MIHVHAWSHMLNIVRFLVSDMSKKHGRPITQMEKYHPLGVLLPFTYVLYQDICVFLPTASSPV